MEVMDDMFAVTLSQPYNVDDLLKRVKLSDAIGIGLFPLALSFLLPAMMSAIVLEKQEKLREMMMMVRDAPLFVFFSFPLRCEALLSLDDESKCTFAFPCTDGA